MKEKLLTLRINGQNLDFTNQGIPSGGLNYGKLSIVGIITWGIDVLLFVAVIAALLMVIYGGFLWLTSEGDAKKVEAAKQVLIYAVLGLVVSLLVFTIANTIAYVLNINPFFGQTTTSG